jgi:hypothetical protein
LKIAILFLSILIFFPVLTYSQHSLTIGVFGGAIIPTGIFADGYNISPSLGIEGYYPIDPNVDFAGDIAYTFLAVKNPGSLTSNDNYHYLESSVGLRLNLISSKVKFFIAVLVGAYNFGVNYEFNGIKYSSNSTSFGMSGGGGVLFPINRHIEFSVQGKFHNIFTPINSTDYIGFTGGLNYKF